VQANQKGDRRVEFPVGFLGCVPPSHGHGEHTSRPVGSWLKIQEASVCRVYVVLRPLDNSSEQMGPDGGVLGEVDCQHRTASM
jgi:hypothetical protein